MFTVAYSEFRNQASLLAFTLPQNWKAGTGISIVATHVDSPNLRIRPISKKTSAGYLQVGIETYGIELFESVLQNLTQRIDMGAVFGIHGLTEICL